MTLVLVTSCMTTPVNLAFPADEDSTDERAWTIINAIIDLLFLIDIFVIFNTAIYDQYFQIIEDRKQIAIIYLKGWFAIDVLAILPFDLILNAGGLKNGSNAMVRFARIGRLYRLVKLTRLLRVIKIMKDKNKFMKIFSDLL